ncbi:MAG: ABC transporter ATP-binding protein [Deltaproteobacteria bacterium]|nr:ABC transporter ATP-binding protein [Deltaproteobacteria bacterium]
MNHSKSNHVLLHVKNLKTYFFTDEGVVRAVDDVSIVVHHGETLGIVGESGCGKSVTALSIMQLIPWPPGKIVGGEVCFADRGDLNTLAEQDMRRIRGNEISMIFQEPMTSLNPVFRIGNQIAEAIRLHRRATKKEVMDKTVEMLKLVGISSPERRVKDYPHHLSGGMRQRVMIAMALSCNPRLMLADEPTTALDVTIQAQILDLMNKLKQEVGTSIILITHNLGVIAEMAQNVSVMYAGVVVENADVRTLFAKPVHPYTAGLLTSIPRAGRKRSKRQRLNTIPGIVPSLLELPVGCRFNDRCAYVHEPCRKWEPPLAPVDNASGEKHLVRCWLHLKPPSV